MDLDLNENIIPSPLSSHKLILNASAEIRQKLEETAHTP